jgi:hypothetical protein
MRKRIFDNRTNQIKPLIKFFYYISIRKRTYEFIYINIYKLWQINIFQIFISFEYNKYGH